MGGSDDYGDDGQADRLDLIDALMQAGAAHVARLVNAIPVYWLTPGTLIWRPRIHNETCALYGAGRGYLVTLDDLGYVDPHYRSRQCRLCGGLWGDLDT